MSWLNCPVLWLSDEWTAGSAAVSYVPQLGLRVPVSLLIQPFQILVVFGKLSSQITSPNKGFYMYITILYTLPLLGFYKSFTY